jgi:hypothetical protein
MVTGQSHVNFGTQRAVMRSLLGAISIVLKPRITSSVPTSDESSIMREFLHAIALELVKNR